MGSAGMYLVVVALPAFQQEFGMSRGGASISYAMVMVGFGIGGILFGRLVDRFGIIPSLAISAIALGFSFIQASYSESILSFNMAHVQIGFFGCAVIFAPLVSDISKWFVKRRGLAVSICACGNYLAGAIWPPMFFEVMENVGWRVSYIYVGIVSSMIMLPTLLVLYRPSPNSVGIEATSGSLGNSVIFDLSPNRLTLLLCLAGLGCCVAMAMPTVHIVSLCTDRGYGVGVGAKMLSVMLLCGVLSRLGFGLISDKIGGLRTILIGSILQCIALLFYLSAQSLPGLFAVSVLFGLFQGGIVPCYALIVREYFPASEAGFRLGIVISATVIGMAVGGWVSGAIYDWTNSYSVAFIHGIGWNCVNLAVILFLLAKSLRR